MRPLPGNQQLEPALAQAASGRQVNRAEAGEPARQQLLQCDLQNREDRDAQERLPVQRPGPGGSLLAASYDCVMTESDAAEGLPSPSSALLQLARLKAGMSQRELAERAGVPVTMISAYERDQRQPTVATLLRLLRAAGFDLRLHLAAYDPHDEILAGLEAGRSEAERDHRDRQLQAWRDAVPADGAA